MSDTLHNIVLGATHDAHNEYFNEHFGERWQSLPFRLMLLTRLLGREEYATSDEFRMNRNLHTAHCYVFW